MWRYDMKVMEIIDTLVKYLYESYLMSSTSLNLQCYIIHYCYSVTSITQ